MPITSDKRRLCRLCPFFSAKLRRSKLTASPVAKVASPRALKPDDGIVSLDGLRGEDVSLMFQEGALFDSLNVVDNVAFPLVSGNVPTEILGRSVRLEVLSKVYQALEQVGLSDAGHKMPSQLSGGMRRRASLARAVVSRPKLLLLDDPTGGLDPVASRVIRDLIVRMHGQYRPTIVLVSQDLRRLLPDVGKVVALFDGVVKFSGTASDLRESSTQDIQEFVSCRYDFRSKAA